MKFIALFLAVMVGILIGTQKSKNLSFAKFLLVFSAGFLLTVCVTEMLPIIYTKAPASIGIFVLLGVLLQIVLEFFSKGIEHGHAHIENESKVPLGLVFGLLLHSFIEGIPIADTHHDIEIQNLWIAIALHKIPIAIMYAYAINQMAIEPKIKYALYMLFAFATPLGMYIGEVLPENIMLQLYALNAGIFLHISALIIFESNKNHTFNLQKLMVLLLGIIAGFFI